MKNRTTNLFKIVPKLLFWSLLFHTMLFGFSTMEAQRLKDLRIDVELKNTSLERVFSILEEKTGFSFIYIKGNIPGEQRIAVQTSGKSVEAILRELATDFNLKFNRINNQIVVKRGYSSKLNISKKKTGIIIGKVLDAETDEPLISANVLIKGTLLGAATNKEGHFKISNVPEGKVVVSANYMGYKGESKKVIVKGGNIVEVDFNLTASIMDLDDIVVAGSMVEVKKKSSATPVTVISSKKLEQMPIQNLSDLFSGYIPGGYAVSNDFGGSEIGLRGLADFTNVVKTYIDGIHVTNDNAKAVDYRNVEKIEILRGPQASTLYGSGASGGVILITTKKGSKSGLKVSLNNSLTVTKKNYAPSTPISRDHKLTLSSGNNMGGYSFSIRHTKQDPLTETNDVNPGELYLSGKTFIKSGSVTANLSGSFSKYIIGSYLNPILSRRSKEKNYPIKYYEEIFDTKYETENKMMTLDIKNILSNNFFHTLTIGYTNSETENTMKEPGMFSYGLNSSVEYNLKYLASFNKNISDFSLNLVGGFEYVNSKGNNQDSMFDKFFEISEGEQSLITNLGMSDLTNTGYFFQGIFGIKDKMFLTTGLRLEKHESYGDDVGFVSSPKVGLAYTINAGWFVAKPRIAYGQATNPPGITQKLGSTREYGNGQKLIILANKDLKPSKQKGYEIGGDFYFGDNISLELTYYNQEVDDAIAQEMVSSDSLAYIAQNRNIGTLKNKGLELALNAYLGRVTLYSSFTVTRSTTEARIYKTANEDENDMMIYIPQQTGTFRINYSLPKWLTVSPRGGNINFELFYQGKMKAADQLSEIDASMGIIPFPEYRYIMYDSYIKLRLRANMWVTDYLKVYLDGKNLTNEEQIDGNNSAVGRGRSIEVGCYLQF